MQERLQKILSRAGIASRRGAEKVMSEGRVTKNGETVTELGTKADLASDDIRVDGVRVRAPQQAVYLALNKPKGVVTTRHDPEGRTTVMELVPAVAGLFPVGRLDVTTEGLILLTNDGAFAERVSHPRYEVPRVYQAKVRRVPSPETLARMRQGLRVDGERMAVDEVRVLEAANNSWLEVVLHEGKHHEVRRLLEAVGHPVSKLRRVSLGPVTTRGLDPGQFRHLTEHEVRALLAGGRPRQRPRTSLPSRPPGAARPTPAGRTTPTARATPTARETRGTRGTRGTRTTHARPRPPARRTAR